VRSLLGRGDPGSVEQADIFPCLLLTSAVPVDVAHPPKHISFASRHFKPVFEEIQVPLLNSKDGSTTSQMLWSARFPSLSLVRSIAYFTDKVLSVGLLGQIIVSQELMYVRLSICISFELALTWSCSHYVGLGGRRRAHVPLGSSEEQGGCRVHQEGELPTSLSTSLSL
jgi:hypothetical protein